MSGNYISLVFRDKEDSDLYDQVTNKAFEMRLMLGQYVKYLIYAAVEHDLCDRNPVPKKKKKRAKALTIQITDKDILEKIHAAAKKNNMALASYCRSLITIALKSGIKPFMQKDEE